MSPSAPVPKSSQPRQLNDRKHLFYTDASVPGRSKYPSSRFPESDQKPSGRPIPCGQIGRFVQMWNLAHLSDDAGLDAFDGAAQPVRRAPLIAHLRDDAGFVCQITQVTGFINGLCQRLLAIDVFARRIAWDSAMAWK